MHVELRDQCFDPWAELTAFRNRMLSTGQYGACAVFVGTMRDYNEGDRVRSMYLEHYPGMTEKQLESLVSASCETNNLMEALVVHRVGTVNPGEDIVLVAVWSAHRKASFRSFSFSTGMMTCLNFDMTSSVLSGKGLR